MKVETIEVFVAFPDMPNLRREFETAAEARTFERDNAPFMLVGMTAEKIAAALAGTDPDLSDAIETVGKQCERNRLDRGDRRRKPSQRAANGNGADPGANGADDQGSQPQADVGGDSAAAR